MNFLQFEFWVFLCAVLFIYYIIPKRFQWICLLIGSYVFYCYTGIKTVVFIMSTTISVWAGALYISKINKDKEKLLLKASENISKTKKEIRKSKEKYFGLF